MKCPSCGAESKGSICEYCGSEIYPKKMGVSCSQCGSANVVFQRENQGEIHGKKSRQVVYRTVGYCQDCGNTWVSAEDAPKERKTWLWVLGWIFLFPLPLTILLLRKKEMKPYVKYAIIAVAWIAYLLIGMSGSGSDNRTTVPGTASQPQMEETTQPDAQASADEASQEDASNVPTAGTDTSIQDQSAITVWQDFSDASYPWEEEPEFETRLDEFPNTVFIWKTHRMQSYTEILLQENGEEIPVVQGMPIENAFFVDLNSDGYRELCATVWFGSGVSDTHIIAYDHRHTETDYLWDPALFDYRLYQNGNELYVKKTSSYVKKTSSYVKKTSSEDGKEVENGPLALENGTLCIKSN